jgi:hypothetical protein
VHDAINQIRRSRHRSAAAGRVSSFHVVVLDPASAASPIPVRCRPAALPAEGGAGCDIQGVAAACVECAPD